VDAFGDHLAGGAKLFADGLVLAHQRCEHAILRALSVDEIAAEHLRRRLQLAIDAAVALL